MPGGLRPKAAPALAALPATLVFMLAPVAALYLSFGLARSVLLGFILYYLVSCLSLPALDLLLLRKVGPRRALSLVGLGRPSKGELALGLGTGAAMALVAVAALALFKTAVFGDGRIGAALREWGVSGGNIVAVFAVMLAFNGAVEELFWRGYLYDRLRSLGNRPLALGLPALVFGAQHFFVLSRLVADPAVLGLFLFGIFGAGLIWSLMRERSGGAVGCAISHMLVTAGYMGAFFFLGM